MKPDTDVLIRNLANHLATDVIPEVDSTYLAADLAVVVKLLYAAAADFDHVASRLVDENSAMRHIFSEALPVIADEDLKGELNEALDTTESDYRISSLGKSNAGLKDLLCRLHEHVENLEGPVARQLEDAIWQELSLSTQRRLLAAMGIAAAGSVLQSDGS